MLVMTRIHHEAEVTAWSLACRLTCGVTGGRRNWYVFVLVTSIHQHRIVRWRDAAGECMCQLRLAWGKDRWRSGSLPRDACRRMHVVRWLFTGTSYKQPINDLYRYRCGGIVSGEDG